MWRDRAVRTDLEQATLRVRLAATALGATVLLLVPGQDQVAAASLLVGYATVALVLRAHGARLPASDWLGLAMDVLFATGLCLLLPLSAAWALYLFAIGIAALRLGVNGLLVATAASVVAYDVALVLRSGEALASDLWRIQVLLAFAVLVTELVWATGRVRAEQRELRAYSLAQRDLAAAAETDDLLDRLADHSIRSFGASSAWILRGDARPTHVRGAVDRVTAVPDGATAVFLAEDITLHAAFEDEAARARGAAALRDLAADTRPLLEAAQDRARQRREREGERRALEAIQRLGRETTRAGVLAQAVSTAQEHAGPSAIVRVADGERAVGDLEAEVATAIARDGVAPRLVRGPSGATAAVVTAGRGLSLVALGTRRPLGDAELAALTLIGEATATALERVTERGVLVATAAELRRRGEELEREVRQRDDAVASAVHELRNPLTSVQAYGQLMSRHLAAVQRQVSQLDALIGDLLGPPGSQPRPGASDHTDVAREAMEAAARLRVSVSGSDVTVETAPGEDRYDARIDAGRFAQVIDNVLRNAAKYSPPGAPIEVTVTRRDDEVLVSVSDRGDGIAAEDLERIFDRYARGAQHTDSVAGAGIGLAISREIVAAHGGRIWAESAGLGNGSTFRIALPAAPVTEETAPVTNGGAAAR